MHDLIVKYMKAIADAPKLSKEEERCLIKLAQNGDEEAKNKFIKSNLKLVVKIVLGFSYVRQNKTVELLDLFQECNISLLKALERFDLKMDYKFSTYAAWWIRNAIFETLSKTSKIKIPRYVTSAVNLYYKEINQALGISGIMPSMEAITEKIEIPIRKMRKFLKLFQDVKTVSLDDGIASSMKDRWNKKSISSYLSDKKNVCPEKLIQIKQLEKKTRKMLLTLTPREEKVLRMLFGVGEKKDHTLDEIGNVFSITRERVRQIKISAIKKLHKKFVIGPFNKERFQLKDYL